MTSRVAARAARRVLRSPHLTESAVLVRQQRGIRNDYGEWVPGSTVETPLRLATAPLNGDERAALPEGLRERDVRKFWTTAAASAIVAGDSEGDLVRYDSIEYRAIQVEDWGGFREILAVRPELT